MTTALQRGEHGTTSYRLGCRCSICRRAMRDGAQLDRLAAAVRRGRQPSWRVRSHPARRRVVELRARGWTLAEIAVAAGVAVSSVHRVLVARRCSSLVERAILGVDRTGAASAAPVVARSIALGELITHGGNRSKLEGSSLNDLDLVDLQPSRSTLGDLELTTAGVTGACDDQQPATT